MSSASSRKGIRAALDAERAQDDPATRRFLATSDANMFIPVDQDAEGVAAWIWHNLVPPSGRARSVQGELLRAVEQLRWEAQSNSNVNWDERFESHVQFLEDVLSGEASFSAEAKALIARDLERLRTFITPADLGTREGALPYVEDDLYDRLVHSIVAFCREHPATIQPG